MFSNGCCGKEKHRSYAMQESTVGNNHYRKINVYSLAKSCTRVSAKY